jgi:CheY-like chemotaxis protein
MSAPVVLYVEDEPGDVILMQIAFERAGLAKAFQSVPDGKHAMSYLAGENSYADRVQHPFPSVLLLDLNLPVVSGFAVLEWMRKRPDLRELPVVVFSSSMLPEDKARSREMGAKDFIEKPGSVSGFADVVNGLKAKWLT